MEDIIYNYDFTNEDMTNWKTLGEICEKEKVYEGNISNLMMSLSNVTDSDQIETIFKEVDTFVSAKKSIIDEYPSIKVWIEKIISILDIAMGFYISSSRESKDNFVYEFNFYAETPFIRVSRMDKDKGLIVFNDNFKASQKVMRPLSYLGIYVGNWDSKRVPCCSRYSS